MTVIIPHGFEANYTLGFVRGLARNEVPVCVISDDLIHDRLADAGIEAINLRGSLDENRSALAKAINLLRYYFYLLLFLVRRRHSVVHFTGIFRNRFILFEGLVLQAAFRLFSRRYVYTAHNVLPHNKQHSRFYRAVYRCIYRIPHSIVVHATKAREQIIQEFGVPASRITVMSIGLNEEVPLTGLTAAGARERLGLNSSEQVILFFGKIDEYKGLDLLIDAFAALHESLPDARLVIAGAFRSESYRKRIMAKMDCVPCRARILFRDEHVSNAEVEAYFKAADVAVLPYRNIYQSGVIFLALRFGTPVIASDVGSISEFIDAESGIMVPPDDAGSLAQALRAFFSRRNRFESARIRKRATRYQWENVCGVVTPIYG